MITVGAALVALFVGWVVNVLADRWSAASGVGVRRGRRLPGRRPVVAVTTVVLLAATAQRFGASWSLPPFLVLAAGLMALAVVDAEVLLLPRSIVYPCLVAVAGLLVVAAGAEGRWSRLGGAVVAGIATWIVFAVLHRARPASLGFGDVRLAGLLGVSLGWLGPVLPAVAVLVGCTLAVLTWTAARLGGRADRTSRLPFGTFLAAGTVAAYLLAP